MCNLLMFLEPKLARHMEDQLDGGDDKDKKKHIGVDAILQEKLDVIGDKVAMLEEVPGYFRMGNVAATNGAVIIGESTKATSSSSSSAVSSGEEAGGDSKGKSP